MAGILVTRHLLLALPLLLALALPFHARAAAEDVVYKDKAGRVLTEGDVKDSFGRLRAIVVLQGGPHSLKAIQLRYAAERAHDKDNETALRYYQAAADESPRWPYPTYTAATIYLDQKNYAKAYEFYRRVDRLSPRGFLRTRTALYTLEQEQQGKLPVGTYLLLTQLEWMFALDMKKATKTALDMTARRPDFAPGWQELAKLEDDPAKRLVLIEKGLSKNPDVETRGALLVAKAEALAERGNKAVALQMLGDLALDPASTGETETLAKSAIGRMLFK